MVSVPKGLQDVDFDSQTRELAKQFPRGASLSVLRFVIAGRLRQYGKKSPEIDIATAQLGLLGRLYKAGVIEDNHTLESEWISTQGGGK